MCATMVDLTYLEIIGHMACLFMTAFIVSKRIILCATGMVVEDILYG